MSHVWLREPRRSDAWAVGLLRCLCTDLPQHRMVGEVDTGLMPGVAGPAPVDAWNSDPSMGTAGNHASPSWSGKSMATSPRFRDGLGLLLGNTSGEYLGGWQSQLAPEELITEPGSGQTQWPLRVRGVGGVCGIQTRSGVILGEHCGQVGRRCDVVIGSQHELPRTRAAGPAF